MTVPLYIRADATPTIGTGHVMRCLALGQEWRKFGGEVVFVGRIAIPSLAENVVAEGFRWVPVDALGGGADEAAAVADWLAAESDMSSWVVLDGYDFDADYQRRVRPEGRLLVVDDDALLPEYRCDIVLNQNIHAPGLSYPVQEGCSLLLGPRYALLRHEFQRAAIKEDHPEMAKKMLITMGGADPQNVTAAILESLAEASIEDLEVRVIVGPANPHGQHLQTLAVAMPFRCEIVHATNSEMPALMQWADAAITAAGITTYEMAALGVPFLAVAIVDNQQQNAAGLVSRGITEIVHAVGTVAPVQLAARIIEFLRDADQRLAQAAAGRRLVDGQGAKRVVTAMRAKEILLRPVCPEDQDLLLRWANDEESRKNSFDTSAIAAATHAQWFAAKLTDPDCTMYLALTPEGTPLGVARFERAGNKAVISVGLDRDFRRQGWGGSVIRAACDRLFGDRSVVEVEALVKAENHGSLRAFDKANFALSANTERNGIPAVALHCRREPQNG